MAIKAGHFIWHYHELIIVTILLKGSGSFENEALENEDRSKKHPKLENEAPKIENEDPKISKTKHPKLETTVGCTSCMTQSESGGGSGCVRTSKGPQQLFLV